MTVFTNLDYKGYNQQVVKLSKQFRYMALTERKECLRLYPEVLMYVENPSEGEMFVAVTMKPSLVLFLNRPSKFIYLVAMALDPTLMCQLTTPQRKKMNGGVVDATAVKSHEDAAHEFNVNSFNVVREHPTHGLATVAMRKIRADNTVLDGQFDDYSLATHQDAMRQIQSILTLARALNEYGQFDMVSVKWLLPCLPVVTHWALPMVAAALGVHMPAYGKLEDQPSDVLETLFAFNGADAFTFWNEETRNLPLPAGCWEAMLRTDGRTLNALDDRDYKHRADPSAKLCKLALSNVSGVDLLLYEGGSQSRTFKRLKLDSLKLGFTEMADQAASEYENVSLAKASKLRKRLVNILGI